MNIIDSNEPLVTIITTCFNSENFIEQCIESVLYQDYRNIEYIILDDNSNDKSWEIINRFSDNRIIAIKNEKNLGEYFNRNKGLELAKGKYIIFIDGDDVALNKGITLAVLEMEKYTKCGFGIVKTENPKFIGSLEISSQDAYNLEYFGGGFLNSSLTNNIFRKSSIKGELFDSYYPNADTYFRLNLLKSTSVLVLVNPIGLWRLSKNQASKKISYSQQLLQHISFLKTHLFEDEFFDLIDKQKLRVNYYNMLFNLIKQEILKLDFLKIISLKQYFIDNYTKAIQYSFKKKDNSFWAEYNYENLNINLKGENTFGC